MTYRIASISNLRSGLSVDPNAVARTRNGPNVNGLDPFLADHARETVARLPAAQAARLAGVEPDAVVLSLSREIEERLDRRSADVLRRYIVELCRARVASQAA